MGKKGKVAQKCIEPKKIKRKLEYAQSVCVIWKMMCPRDRDSNINFFTIQLN